MEDNQPNFIRELLSAFRYPFSGDGAYVIVGGAVFFTLAAFASSFAGILGLLIQLAITGFIAAYARDVVQTTSMGDDRPPKWTDFSDWSEDLLVPALQFLFVGALAFGFMIFLEFKNPFSGVAGEIMPGIALGFGCIVFPILFLAVAMMDSVAAVLNPVPLVRAVSITLPTYLSTVIFFSLMFGLNVGVNALLDGLTKIPLLSSLVGGVLDLYVLVVAMRSVGLYYRYNHERLEWY